MMVDAGRSRDRFAVGEADMSVRDTLIAAVVFAAVLYGVDYIWFGERYSKGGVQLVSNIYRTAGARLAW